MNAGSPILEFSLSCLKLAVALDEQGLITWLPRMESSVLRTYTVIP